MKIVGKRSLCKAMRYRYTCYAQKACRPINWRPVAQLMIPKMNRGHKTLAPYRLGSCAVKQACPAQLPRSLLSPAGLCRGWQDPSTYDWCTGGYPAQGLDTPCPLPTPISYHKRVTNRGREHVYTPPVPMIHLTRIAMAVQGIQWLLGRLPGPSSMMTTR